MWPNLPLPKSCIAWTISSRVFITKGPWPTIGSCRGSPPISTTTRRRHALVRAAQRRGLCARARGVQEVVVLSAMPESSG
jgi:hypothetical protein